MTGVFVLSPTDRAFLSAARSATLATIAPGGRPRLVPICFVVGGVEPGHSTRIYSPIDEKPKTATEPTALARVRDLLARPRASILAERWSEDWSELGWLRLDVTGDVLAPGEADDAERAIAIERLRAKYPQYAGHHLEDLPLLRFVVTRVTGWRAGLSDPGTAHRRAAADSASSSSPGGSPRR
ncbi:MAG TPA: pyridoxamine 5'-phosphate oxidase family protein [Candidatus Limnocylindrales bacterium]